MILMFDDSALRNYRPRCMRKCGNFCTVISVTVFFITLMTLLAIFAFDMTQKIHVVYMDGAHPKFVTDEKFLSVALDSSLIASGFRHFDLTNPKIVKMMSALSPGYLRVGGTMADRLTFTTSKSLHFKHLQAKPNFTMNEEEWLQLNQLATNTGLDIVFDLNALKRFDNGSWNFANAEKLINFSEKFNLNVNWELGNEPNAFRHQFDYDVTPAQMGRDFQTLREILNKHPKYANSLLLGPDVTRPQNNHNSSETYLQTFLGTAGHVIDAVTWHQYYFNGAVAKVLDFIDPKNFDLLQWQIDVVKSIVTREGVDKPIWLGETSSAYGGGAPHLSNRYIATFLWLDKLGMAARSGLSVVIRQSIFQGNYALINSHYYPTPDWWVSVVYKKLVGNKVVDCHLPQSDKIRLYCHCTNPRSYHRNAPSVTVFGVNISNRLARIRFEGVTEFADSEEMKKFKVDAYILTTVDRIDSRFIYLNGHQLVLTEANEVPDLFPKTVVANPYVEMPPFSLGFWVLPITSNVLPYC